MAKKEESSNSTNLSEETKQMTQRSSSQKVKEIKEKDLKDEIILTKKDMKKNRHAINYWTRIRKRTERK